VSHNKDSEILYFVREFHLVTEVQLQMLTGRQTLWRRLPVLAAQKKLYRTRRGRYTPYVYAAYNITKRREFDHDLLVTDIHIALYKTGSLLEWEQPKQKKENSLNEDAYCVIAVYGADVVKELHCYIEADTGSEPDWQIRTKTDRYLSYYGKHKKPFRVLFIAPNERRTHELVRVAQRSVPQEVCRMFLFASIEKFKVEPFGAICSVCHYETPVYLIPTMLTSRADIA
jgi:hypothetical protein